MAFREPTRALPLRWGNYTDRYLIGLLFIVSGGMYLQGSNPYTLSLLLVGTIVHAVGWSILPAAGWRRMIAVIPATAQLWIVLTGPFSAWTFVVPYLCWLLVRHRPARSYVTALLPLANGIIIPFFYTEYSGMLPTLGISLVICVVAAWIARMLAASPARTAGLSLPISSDRG